MKKILVFICFSVTIIILEIIASLLIGFPNRFRSSFYNPMSWQDILDNKLDFVYSSIIVSIPLTILYFSCKERKDTKDKKIDSHVQLKDPILDKIIKDAMSGKTTDDILKNKNKDSETEQKENNDSK